LQAYYGEVWLKHQEHPVEASIFRELPNALRMRVGVTITKSLVRSVLAFQGLSDDTLEAISSRIVPVETPPGTTPALRCGGQEPNCPRCCPAAAQPAHTFFAGIG
jgi:hypothetical protein